MTIPVAPAAPVTPTAVISSGPRKMRPRCECCQLPAKPVMPVTFSLLRLPTDVLRRILLHSDISTLRALSLSCRALEEEVQDDRLWQAAAIRRFRVTPRVKSTRRLQAARVDWRTLYVNWHAQGRMPATRFSGPGNTAFARGRSAHGTVLLWITVASADDCRLSNNALNLRVVAQNVANAPTRINASRALTVRVRGKAGTVDCRHATSRDVGTEGRLEVLENVVVDADNKHTHLPYDVKEKEEDEEEEEKGCTKCSCCPKKKSTGTKKKTPISAAALLKRDEVQIIFTKVTVEKAVFEVDALERIESVVVPVSIDGRPEELVTCNISDRHIFEAYELLPGGWWARVG